MKNILYMEILPFYCHVHLLHRICNAKTCFVIQQMSLSDILYGKIYFLFQYVIRANELLLSLLCFKSLTTFHKFGIPFNLNTESNFSANWFCLGWDVRGFNIHFFSFGITSHSIPSMGGKLIRIADTCSGLFAAP